MTPKKCILCGCDHYEVIATYNAPDQYEAFIGITADNYRRAWVRCRECAFIYSIYSRDERALDELYEKAYRGDKVPWRKMGIEETFKKVVNLPEKESETETRIKWIKEEIARLQEHALIEKRPGPLRLLDIGGGNGIFAFEFQNQNWKSSIVDPNDGGKFVESIGLKFAQGFYRPGMFDQKFDMLSLVYVLEHVLDPVAVIGGSAADLNADGFLFIEVPDAINFKLKPPDDDIFNSCHLWMFDPLSLGKLLDLVGYDLLSMKRFKALKGHYGIMVLAVAK